MELGENKRESTEHEKISKVCSAKSISISDGFLFSAHHMAMGMFAYSVIYSLVHVSIRLWHRNFGAGICCLARNRNLRN